MSRIGSWIRGSAKPVSSRTAPVMSTLDESEYLEDALQAATMIMNDDIEGADAQLQKCDSSFHQLGLGVTIFMRSLLGFEQEIMKQAMERLAEAEATAWSDMKKAQKASDGFNSTIYPAGSEFALCYAQSMLMSAVVAVLNENLTEGIKGFYKLKKAYVILDGLLEVEKKHFRSKNGLGGSSKTSLDSQKSKVKAMPGGFGDDDPYVENPSSKEVDAITNQTLPAEAADEDSDLDFVDAEEDISGKQTPAAYDGHLDVQTAEEKLEKLSINSATPSGISIPSKAPVSPAKNSVNGKGPDSDMFTDPIDIFVHSGSNLCFGILQLILSLVPPAFSKLLYVIGFKGDRERGVNMLWQSTKFQNINGAVAGLILLGYYNGVAGFCDILPTGEHSEDIMGYPDAKCEAMLEEMKIRYPQGRLWKLEAGRMQAKNRQLRKAIATLDTNNDSKMKQISALNMFEKSLDAMYLHDYALASSSFITCIDMNNWSHSLYYYIAGACQVELYRNFRETDPKQATVHRNKALEYLKKAPTLAGKKRLLAKQLPLDTFVIRKVQKWEERAKAWNHADFIDCIGVSPVEEMIYLWNGTKRMSSDELNDSLKALDWSRVHTPDKHQTNLDERAIHSLLYATVLRNQGKFEEARTILNRDIISQDRNAFKGPLKDDWTCPSAHYEMGVLAWVEKDVPGVDERTKVAECEAWVEKTAKWEAYVLDARIGLRVTTAQDTLKRHKTSLAQ